MKKRVLSIVMTLVMIISVVMIPNEVIVNTEAAGTVPADFKKRAENKTVTLNLSWDMNYFKQSATIYNHDLALTALALSNASYESSGEDMVDILEKLGFSNFDGDYPKDNDWTKSLDRVAYTFAYNKENKVIAVVLRGTPSWSWTGGNYPDEWIDNIARRKDGFSNATLKVRTALQAYMKGRNIRADGCKFFITGHSRGGAVANLLGVDISDWGDSHKEEENVFVYAFATPNCTNDSEIRRTAYKNIFNICNSNDNVVTSKWTAKYKYGKIYLAAYVSSNKSVKAHWPESYLSFITSSHKEKISELFNGRSTTYTLSYNANGGSNSPTDQKGSTITISSSMPTKNGYTFKGWATSSTATSAAYKPGGKISLQKNMTLYAVWQKNESIEITNINKNMIANPGKNYTLRLCDKPSENNTRIASIPNGTTIYVYGFATKKIEGKAWAKVRYKSNDGWVSADWLKDSAAITATATYTLSYNANGGNGAPSKQTKKANESWTVSGTKPSKTGYDFLGWSESAAATSAKYQSGDKLSQQKNITLYAVWDKTAVSHGIVTVQYNANGGIGAPTDHSVYADGKGDATFTLSSKVPTKSGYKFLYWIQENNSGYGYYDPGQVVSINYGQGNHTLTYYAFWGVAAELESAKTITISYDANGGVGAPSSDTVTIGEIYTMSMIAPTRDGYRFEGWGMHPDSTVVVASPGKTYAQLKISVTYYAIWKVNITGTVTIKYDANGGIGAPNLHTVKKDSNGNVTFTFPLVKPTRSGYSFQGWALEGATFVSGWYQSGETIIVSAGNADTDATFIYYAQWVKLLPGIN